MELKPSDVQNIEKLVRSVVTEVCRTRTSASVPKFAGGKTFEKRLESPEISNISSAISSGRVSDSVSSPLSETVKGGDSKMVSPNPPAEAPKRQRLKTEDLLLDKQVVTLRDVENLPRTAKRLIVPQSALLTPSVHDFLNEQNIRLARYSRETIESLRADVPQTISANLRAGALEVYALFTQFRPETHFASWTKAGWRPNLHSGFIGFDNLRESIAQNQTLSILFTSKVDEALCRLNRNERIFAISAVSPQRLARRWTVFPSINTIVLDPADITVYLAGQIVQRAAELFYL